MIVLSWTGNRAAAANVNIMSLAKERASEAKRRSPQLSEKSSPRCAATLVEQLLTAHVD